MFKDQAGMVDLDTRGNNKEWYQLIVQQLTHTSTGMLFHPIFSLKMIHLGLLRRSCTDEATFLINEDSTKLPDFELKYEFLGSMLARSIIDGNPISLNLNQLVFKLLKNPKCELGVEDLKLFDTTMYKS